MRGFNIGVFLLLIAFSILGLSTGGITGGVMVGASLVGAFWHTVIRPAANHGHPFNH